MGLHLIKLSVGSTGIDSLQEWQNYVRGKTGAVFHTTRMFPKRGDDILRSDGSIYWVIKGVIRCRQRVLGFESGLDDEGRKMCHIMLDPELVETEALPHRAFQGWRYLDPAKAPADRLGGPDEREELPAQMRSELEALGLL